MQLLALDEEFNPIGYFGYINLQWIRRYYEPGEFSVQIPIEMYMSDMKDQRWGWYKNQSIRPIIKEHICRCLGIFMSIRSMTKLFIRGT